jgi:putative phage-type endonuclease
MEINDNENIESDNDSIHSVDYIDYIDNDDIIELTITIYELFDEYIHHNLINLLSSKFYNDMINHTVEIIYTDLYEDEDDEYYDELYDYIKQLSDIFLNVYEIPQRTTENMKDITPEYLLELNEIIIQLEQTPQPVQRTPEWYEFRYNLITASNLNKVFGTNAAINSLICEKCKPLSYTSIFSNVNTSSSLHWGVKYEPVTVMVYEHKYNTHISEFGCIQHPRYSFIGASPDGINTDKSSNRYGRMLEIKNIVNRDITGIPKDEYWVQTQVQMETCNLNECDFVETRFKEYENKQSYNADISREYKGIMLQFYEKMNMNNTQSLSPVYKYMPLFIPDIYTWINEQTCIMREQNFTLLSTIYWYLDEISCILIPRNKQWFNVSVPKIESIWNTILNERVNGYEHRIPKKKEFDIVVETDKMIKSVCLIRLDENGNTI